MLVTILEIGLYRKAGGHPLMDATYDASAIDRTRSLKPVNGAAKKVMFVSKELTYESAGQVRALSMPRRRMIFRASNANAS